MRTPTLAVHREPTEHVDRPLLVGLVVLGLAGVVVISSATRQALLNAGDNPNYYLQRQLVWVVLGIALMAVIARIDYRRFELVTTLCYLLALASLLGVFVVGQSELGATRWYVFGPIEIQPSEFALLAVILAMATYCGRRPEGLSMFDVRRMLLMAGLPFIFIFVQPDLGTAIVMTMVVGAVFVIAGVPPRFLGLLGAVGAIGAVGSVYFGLLHRYQILRLVSFLHQNSSNANLQALIYDVSNAKSAIGAGGLFGAGFGQGLQTTLGYVPEQRTDFIFTAIGEQFGLVGTVSIVLLLGFLAYRMFVVARDAKEPMGRLLAVGIFVFFSFSCFLNIGMTMGIMPVTGIPLPLISYGGSSALVFYLAGGVVLSVSRRRST
jgi:rod shape determining protein RodA